MLATVRVTAAALVFACPFVAMAQESGGKLRSTLREALVEAAKGNCPERLLGALVLDACEQQIARMKTALQNLGAIKELRYRGLEQLPTGGEAEVYRVVFANGQMVWMVAASPNGKLTVFYSPG
jgi:hypothetical protein